MKKIILLFTLFLSVLANATHIVGGEMIYEHRGGSSYFLTVKLYKDCSPGTQNFPNDLEIEAFTGFGLDTIGTLPADDFFILPRLGRDTLASHIDTCAFNPGVCVEEAIYGSIITLPPVPGGYHLFYQTYARNGSLLNIIDPLQAGETFYAYVPDNSLYLTNSSPVFSNSPPVFVCQGYDLDLDFGATDIDGDSLVYSFYNPYTGRSWDHPDHYDPSLYYPTIDLGGTPPDNIEFVEVVYGPGFSEDNPLNAISGIGLTISSTGVINGVPEAIGQYVVGVMVEEYRDGVKIGEIVRDFQFNVLNCPPPQNAEIGDIDGCSGYIIDFENNSGIGAIDFWWDFGTGNPADTSLLFEPTFDYTGLAPGTFTVTLIAQKGSTCADTVYYDLTLSGVIADFIAVDTACTFEPISFESTSTSQINGVLDSWNWDFGDGNTSALENPTHSYASPGDYNVQLIVSSNLGCTDTVNYTIRINTPPGAGIMPMMGCIGLTVDFTSTSDADVDEFFWDFGTGLPGGTSTEENPTFTYSDYGVYDVTLITNPGTFCADTIVYELLVSNATANFEVPDTTCSNTLIDFIDLSTTNNGDIFSWEWDFGDGSSSTAPNPSYGYTEPGTYIITLIVISDIGCSDTISKEITIEDAPAAMIAASDFCSGLTIDFINMSDPGATGFWWDFGTGFPADSSVLANPTFTYPSYGIYTVTLIAQKGTVCETEATLEISLSDLTADFISPDTVCQNTTIDFEDNSETLEGTTITGWEWDFGDLTTSDLENPSHTYDIPGDYLVQLVVTNNVGCTDTLVKSLHVQNQPVVDAGEDVSVCLGDPSVELDGNILFAESGIWSGTGGVFSPSNTNLNATYFPSLDEIDLGYSEIVLTSVGNGSCEAVTDTMLIIYLGFPEVNAGLDIDVCEDSTYVILDATTNFGSTILWTTAGDGTFSDDEALNATYTFGPGDIIDGEIILYIATNNSGCPNVNDSLTITINPPPTLTALSDTTLCSRQSLYLISDVSTENGIWSTSGDGTFDPEIGPWTNYSHGLGDLALGAVTIFFESTDNGGCFAVYDTIQVDILPSPEANFEFTEVCFGTPTEFINTSTSEDPIITNFWTFEPGITSAILNPSHSFSSGGTFDVQLVVISENGCADTLIQDVRSHFIPAVDFDIPYPCLNGGTYFYDSTQIGAGIITEWAWDFGDGSAIDTSQNPIHQYPSQGAYDITLTVSSEFGCTADTMITTLINLGPIAAFTANPPSANLFVNINFTDQSVPNGSPLNYWEWHFGDGDSSFTQNTIHQYDFEGEYNVELIVKDELGCIDTTNNIVPIYHGPLVASAFSPNGDNNNDFLMILGGNYSDIDFKIYNNWGQLIFETKDPQSLGWDGTFKDEPQPLGVYVYVAKVVTYDGVEHVISGDVSLIR